MNNSVNEVTLLISYSNRFDAQGIILRESTT